MIGARMHSCHKLNDESIGAKVEVKFSARVRLDTWTRSMMDGEVVEREVLSCKCTCRAEARSESRVVLGRRTTVS